MTTTGQDGPASPDLSLEPSRVARAFQSAAVYALGGALPRAIALLTLPLYTRVLAPDEYGTFALLVAVASAIAIVFALGLDVAIFRIYFQLDDDGERQHRFVNSTWSLLMVVPALAALVIGLAASPFVGDARFTATELVLALLGSATNVAALTVPLSVLRAEQRLRTFVVVTTFATVATAGLSLIAVVGFGWGVTGWLAGVLVANLATLALTLRVMPYRLPRSIDRDVLRHALAFGAPLVPHSFAHWALQAADRLVIAGIVSGAALGVYSLAASFALPALVLVQSVNYAFMPAYGRAGAGKLERRHLSDVVVLQAATVAAVTLAVALLAPPFLVLATPSTYHDAAALVPWIALGYGFLGLYFIPMNGISLAGGRTAFAAATSLAGAATNILLLYLLVPKGGIRAAAVASAIAYAALLVAVFVYAHRPENPVEYRWRALTAIMVSVALAYVAALAVSSDSGGLTTLATRGGFVLASIVALRFMVTRGTAV